MPSARIKKVVRDFTTRWGRTSLTFAGLVLGLFGVGSVLTAFIILSDDLEANFLQTNPPHIVAFTSDISPELALTMARVPGAQDSEERRRVVARAEVQPGTWLTMVIFVVEDFEDMRIAKAFPETGAWPAPLNGLLMERDGRFFYQAEFGDTLNLRLEDGQEVQTTYEGTVFDPGQAPSRMERALLGYVTRATYEAWNIEEEIGRVLVRVANPGAELDMAQRAAIAVHGGGGQDNGLTVWDVADHMTPVLNYYDEEMLRVTVLDGRSHPHQFQMNSILALLTGLLVVSFLLSAALIINLVDSILAGEVKQIGIIKALGGSRAQIMRDYLFGMALLGGLAAALGVIMATRFGFSIARFVAYFLNFEIMTETLSLWLVPSVVVVGMLIPICVAYLRVRHVASISINEAFQGDNDLKAQSPSEAFGRPLALLPFVPRMAARSLLRRPRRAVLTVLTVSIGLVFFVTALNTRSSLLSTVDAMAVSNPQDLTITFTSQIPVADLEAWVADQSNIGDVEYWQASVGSLSEIDGRRSNPSTVSVVPPNTQMFVPDLLEGHWLDPARPAGVVVTQRMISSYDHVEMGGTYVLSVGSWTGNVQIVGVVKEFTGAHIYVSSTLGEQWSDGPDTANQIYVSLDVSSMETKREAARAMEQSLLTTDWQIGGLVTTAMLEAVILNHVDSIAQVLMVVALTMLIVGALGLASSIGISVMERYREVGIIKAVGGRSTHVLALFIWEGVFIALLGWGIALITAPVLSRAASSTFGTAFVEYPFGYAAAPYGFVIAFAVAVGIAIVASFLPAHSATRLPVREAMQAL